MRQITDIFSSGSSVSNSIAGDETVAGKVMAAALYDPRFPQYQGAKGDAKQFQSCTMTAGSPVLSSSGGTFVTADVGKVVAVNGAGASGKTLVANIISVANGQATLDATAITSITGLAHQTVVFGTNDTTALANQIASAGNGATLYLPKNGTTVGYITKSTLNLDNKYNIKIEGGGWCNNVSDFNGPSILYISADNSAIISAKMSKAFSLIGRGVQYANLGYTGKVIDLAGGVSNTYGTIIKGNRLGGINAMMAGATQAGQAATIINLDSCYGITIEQNMFAIAQNAIQGPNTSVIMANKIVISNNNIFNGGFAMAPIQVMGQAQTISDNIFEPQDNMWSSNKTAGGIQTVQNPVDGTSAVVVDGLHISGNTFEDAGAQGKGICIDLNTIGLCHGVAIVGANQFNAGFVGVRGCGGSGFAIMGNIFRSLYLGVDFSSGTYSGGASPTNIAILGNSYQSCTNNILTTKVGNGSIWDGLKDVNNYMSLGFLGTLRGFSYGFQDYGSAARSAAANGRQGTIQVEKGTLDKTSDRPTICIKANGQYQWIDIPQGSYGGPINLTGQTGSIASTNIALPSNTVLPGGIYEISYYLKVTTIAASSNLTVTFGWNDGAAARTSVSATVDSSALNYTSGKIIVQLDGTNHLTYLTTKGSTGNPTYALQIQVTRLQ